jgi:hypothetical protein
MMVGGAFFNARARLQAQTRRKRVFGLLSTIIRSGTFRVGDRRNDLNTSIGISMRGPHSQGASGWGFGVILEKAQSITMRRYTFAGGNLHGCFCHIAGCHP